MAEDQDQDRPKTPEEIADEKRQQARRLEEAGYPHYAALLRQEADLSR